MSEIRNNYAIAVVAFHFKAKVYRASSPKCHFKITSTNGMGKQEKEGTLLCLLQTLQTSQRRKGTKRKSLVSSGCAYTIFVFQTLCSTPETIHVLKSDNKKKNLKDLIEWCPNV